MFQVKHSHISIIQRLRRAIKRVCIQNVLFTEYTGVVNLKGKDWQLFQWEEGVGTCLEDGSGRLRPDKI